MDMDLDISGWVLEFLVRKGIDDHLIKQVLPTLPLPDNNSSRWKKTMLLRTINSEILEGSVTEKTLDLLEMIAEVDRREGYVVFETMKSAYCAVAVDCTVRYLEENGNSVGKYFDAVERIWRGRIGNLEKSETVDLISDQLRSWMDEIEAAVWDDEVCKKIITRNTRNEALKAVRVYVTEACKIMGPTFLELVAKKMGKSLMESQNLGEHGSFSQVGERPTSLPNASVGGCNEFIMRDVDKAGERAVSSPNTHQDLGVGVDCTIEDETQVGDRGRTCRKDVGDRNKSAAIIENQVEHIAIPLPNVGGDLGVLDEPAKRDTCQFKVTASSKSNARYELGASKSPSIKDNNQCGDGPSIEGAATYCQDISGSTKSASPVENQAAVIAMPLDNSRGKLRQRDQGEERVSMILGAPALRDKEVENGNVLPKRKYVAGHGKCSRRGIKIADVEELSIETSSTKFDCLPSPEVYKVQEALRFSSLELRAVVKDPLPEALSLAEAVIYDMGSKHMNHEPSVETYDKMDVDVPCHSVGERAEAVQTSENIVLNLSSRHQNNDSRPSLIEETLDRKNANPPNSFVNKRPGAVQSNGDNPGYQCSSQQNNEKSPSLMARNGTARTYEWDDSIDGSPEGPSHSRRLHLTSPKRKAVSPLKKYEPAKFVRRRKRWSNVEEDTLRIGVQKFGRGNWKLILNSYRDIFEDRTEVDLKDKWRNMMR